MNSIEKEKLLLNLIPGETLFLSQLAKKAKTSTSDMLNIAMALGCFFVSKNKMGQYLIRKGN